MPILSSSPFVSRTLAFAVLGALATTSCAADVPNQEPEPVSSPLTAAAKAGWRKQVIYLVMPDRFRNGDSSNDDAGAPGCLDPRDPQRFHGGDLEGLRQNLGYVRELGATAIWVTPLNRQIARLPNGHCGYHGYWSDLVDPDDAALEPKLGTSDELKRLAGEMHGSGLRLVLDMVVNHTGDTSTLARSRPAFFHEPRSCRGLGDPTVFCPLDGHPDFAQEKPEVAKYLSESAARWTKTYAIDGIRMDTAKHVPASYFGTSFLPAVRAQNPRLFTVAEVFEEGSVVPLARYVDAGFDSAFHFPLRRALVDGIARGGSIDAVANAVASGIGRLGMDRALDLVLMMDNHDVLRFANEPGFGVPEADIRRRQMLALTLLFTLPGIPQLYYGDELGLYGGADPDNRRDMPAWATRAEERATRHPGEAVDGAATIFAHVKTLSGLRREIPALADGAYRELWRQNGPQNPNVLAFARGVGADARIVVVNNGAGASGMVRIPIPAAVLPDGTALIDELGNGAPPSVGIEAARLSIDLPPRTAAIYRRRP